MEAKLLRPLIRGRNDTASFTTTTIQQQQHHHMLVMELSCHVEERPLSIIAIVLEWVSPEPKKFVKIKTRRKFIVDDNSNNTMDDHYYYNTQLSQRNND